MTVAIVSLPPLFYDAGMRVVFSLFIILCSAWAYAGDVSGSNVYIRIFKLEKVLEMWAVSDDGVTCRLYKEFPICYFSGTLGPKTKQGDKQAPEGFYRVYKGSLNPKSQYYLSFNLGYPNAYDRAQGYTGDYLMVHGKCVSIGCYAMTDPGIREIYGSVEEALNGGQKYVDVHIFPFKMTRKNMKRYESDKWYDFWQMLQPAYVKFENLKIVPSTAVIDGKYVVD